MELNKTISNPMLVGAMELLKAEDTPDHRKLLMDEILRATFLMPAVIEPRPDVDADGKVHMKPGSRVQFPLLTAPDGKQFFMAYTDWSELKRWRDEEDQQTLAFRFQDYARMLFQKDPNGNVSPAAGFVINPLGGNLVIPKEIAAGFMASVLRQAQRDGRGAADRQSVTPEKN